jgi:ribosomal protein L16/L10AE
MLFIRKFFKKKSFFHYKVNKVSRTSTKSLGMRMGKGKGKKRITFFLISQGNFFLEIGISKLRTKRDFLIFYKQISQKLPFRVQKLDSLNLFNSL